MESKDTLISDLVTYIHNGKLQLPDFQRGWVWDEKLSNVVDEKLNIC